MTRDFTYVEDIVDALLRAGTAEAAIGAEMNIASSREIEIVEMAEMVNKLTGNTAGLLYTDRRKWDTKSRLLASVDRAKELLGYDPKTTFEDGLRVTDAASMEIVEMVLAGGINKSIVRAINAAGNQAFQIDGADPDRVTKVKAVGLSGIDANLITAQKLTRTKRDPDSNIERVVELGYVGEPDKVDISVLEALAAQADDDFIPVVAPVGIGPDGKSFNINADTAAGAIAGALKAERVLFLTDITGVLDKDKKLIERLSVDEARGLIADGTAQGGMIPKLETAIQAVEKGVGAAVIMDGRQRHALLMELFTEHGAGTLVHNGKPRG
jgi:acetylglutamate kinase